MEDVIKIVKYLEESSLLMKVAGEIQKKNGFLSILLGTLDATLLKNLMVDKSVIRTYDVVIQV